MPQLQILYKKQELAKADVGVAGFALTTEAAASQRGAKTRAILLPSTTADRTLGPLRPGQPGPRRLWRDVTESMLFC